jgi:hypothetical protein
MIKVVSGSLFDVAEDSASPSEPFISVSWEEFCESFEALLHQPSDSKEAAGLFCPAFLGTKSRAIENVEHCGVIGLDYDEGAMEPKLALRRLAPIAIYIHSTFSSTPEHLRFRIYIPLSRPISASEYKLISRYLLEAYFPDHKFCGASRNPVGLFYLPSMNASSSQEAVFSFRQDGIPLPVEDCLRKASAFFKHKDEEKEQPTNYSSSDDLPPLDDIQRMLGYINPDEYEHYRDVCWILKERYGANAFPLFYEWARKSDKNTRRCRRDIKDFWKRKSRGKGVSIRTLIWLAKKGGFRRMKGEMKMRKKPIESLPHAIQTAFDNKLEQILFDIRGHEYMFLVNYDDAPLIEGILFVADDEAELWRAIDDSGEEYIGESEPEPWRGLSGFLAEKVADIAHIHSID